MECAVSGLQSTCRDVRPFRRARRGPMVQQDGGQGGASIVIYVLLTLYVLWVAS